MGSIFPEMRSEAILSEIGQRIGRARLAQKLSCAEVARRAAVSRRYVAMAEAGQANLSVLKLAALATALRMPLRELCDIDLGQAPLLRVALLGLRGAGKTTVGRELASELEAYQAIYSDCFGRREQREKCHIYLHGLLQELPNKSIETMMLRNNGDDPNGIRAMQHFISQGAWDDEAVLARHVQEVDQDLCDAEFGTGKVEVL